MSLLKIGMSSREAKTRSRIFHVILLIGFSYIQWFMNVEARLVVS